MQNEEECRQATACEFIEDEQEKLRISDPKSYCYNLASKPETICRPKSCPIKKTGVIKESESSIESIKSEKKTKLIPFRKPDKTCVPWDAPEDSSGQDGAPGAMDQGFGGPGGRGPGGRGPGGRGPGGGGPGGKGATGVGGVIGPGGTKSAADSEREAMSLARLAGLAEGPAGVLASFGDAETAKESLASLGAMSTGGALVCECCNCYPCTCGPRGLNIENILAAMRAMMGSGEELQKLIGALGPGAFAAMETLMQKEGGEASKWATGGGTTVSKPGETPSAIALREAWMRGDFDEMTSCHCLPGMCPCPGGHYVFKAKKGKDKGDKDKKGKKKRKRVRRKIKKIGKDGKEYEEWGWVTVTPSDSDKESRLSETCICPPTKHYLTPASSETEFSGRIVAPSKRLYWGDLMVCTCPRLQRTLVILKPEVVIFRDVVMRAIKAHGLDVLSERRIHLTPEEASELYARFYGQPNFPNLIVSVSQAPVVVCSVGGIDAVKIWNNLIGPDGVLPSEWFFPDWISRKYGYSAEIPGAMHASRNAMAGEKENRYFFPETIIDPIMKNEDDVQDYVGRYINPTLLKGLAILAKTRPIDPLIFLAEWLLIHNPFQPHLPANVCLTSS